VDGQDRFRYIHGDRLGSARAITAYKPPAGDCIDVELFEKTGKLGEPSKPGRKKYGLPPATESGGEELKRLLAILREDTGGTGTGAKG